MKLHDWLPGFCIFLLKAAGWITIGIFINFIASKFVELPPNKADLFSIIEVLFAVIITALSIVASFSVSSHWREYELNIKRYSEKIAEKIADEAAGVEKRTDQVVDELAAAEKRAKESGNEVERLVQKVVEIMAESKRKEEEREKAMMSLASNNQNEISELMLKKIELEVAKQLLDLITKTAPGKELPLEEGQYSNDLKQKIDE